MEGFLGWVKGGGGEDCNGVVIVLVSVYRY